MIYVPEFPDLANTDKLKIQHLISEATKHGEMVVGKIADQDIHVWPLDNVDEIVHWLKTYPQTNKGGEATHV